MVIFTENKIMIEFSRTDYIYFRIRSAEEISIKRIRAIKWKHPNWRDKFAPW
jgi:hypothetical protein